VKGSVLDFDEISRAMKGQEIVVSCLGDDNKKTTILTDMAKAIVGAMRKNNLERIAYVATVVHNEIPGIMTKLIINLSFKNAINDHKGAKEYIINNQLKYTFERSLSLLEGDLTKKYRMTLEGISKAGRNISREYLADFWVNAVENNERRFLMYTIIQFSPTGNANYIAEQLAPKSWKSDKGLAT